MAINEIGIYNVSRCKGEYVRKIKICKHCSKGKVNIYGSPDNGSTCPHCEGNWYSPQDKIFRVECWRGDLRRWQLEDVENINRCVYLKPGTKVFAGFTY